MSEIRCNPEALLPVSQSFSQIALELEQASKRIASLGASLNWQVRAQGSIDNDVQKAVCSAQRLAEDCEHMGRYINYVAFLFQKADKNGAEGIERMIKYVGATAIGFVGLIFNGITHLVELPFVSLGWIKKIIEPVEFTNAINNFQKDRWSVLPYTERVREINKLVEYFKKVLGIEGNFTVVVETLYDENGNVNTNTHGGYSHGLRILRINAADLENPGFLIAIIAHECKHAQQHENTDNVDTINDLWLKLAQYFYVQNGTDIEDFSVFHKSR